MRARTRQLLSVLAVCLGLGLGAWGCGDDENVSNDDAGTSQADAGPGPDAGDPRLERPPVLPRPPSGGLPDELRPPR